MYRAFDDVEFFEDYAVGDRFRTGPVTFAEDEIIAFARKYDPQPFHIDREAAARSHFGGIIAPGDYVLSLCWGHIIGSGFLNGRAMGASGMDNVRWHKPVRPGDALRVEAEVLEIRESSSRTDRGYITFRIEMIDQHDELAMSFTVPQIMERRPR